MGRRGDLETCLDEGRIGPFQVLVIGMCALLVMIDGFDTQVIGMVAPAIAAAWGLPPAAFSAVFGMGLFGGLLGALFLGGAGDRFGRKPVLLFSILLFAGVTLLTPFTKSVPGLIAVRFVSGVGLGGALPGLIAITSEYAPKALRARVTALMYCGFPLGSVLAGIISAQMTPVFGWGSVFYIGGILPLLVLPVFVAVVPESVRFLALKGDRARVAKILARMNGELEWNGEIAPQPAGSRGSVVGLFSGGRALGTVLLWSALFLSLLLSVFLVNWLPLLARGAGIGMKSAVLAVSALNIGGIVGCYLIGRMSGRLGLTRSIGLAYGAGAIAVALLGFAGQSGTVLLASALVAGMFVVGAQMSIFGLAASFYDTSLRGTGVGWAVGAARVGAVVGPVVGGLLIAAGMPIPTLFAIAGLVSLAAAFTVFGLYPAAKRVSVASDGGPLPTVGLAERAH